MKKKKVPLRKCVVTGEMKPKADMIRVVKNDEGVAIDPSGRVNGRGAYVSLDVEVAKDAMKKQALDRPLNTKVPVDFYEELIAYIDHQVARRELTQG